MVRPVERDSRGIVAPGRARAAFDLVRLSPGPMVAPFVDRLWHVSWDLPDGAVHHQEILSHPVVNLVVQGGEATVTGVLRRRSTRRIEGRDQALGIMFRPGGFAPFLEAPVSTLTDLAVPIEQVFGADGRRYADEVTTLLRDGADDTALLAAVDGLLGARASGNHDTALIEELEHAAVERSVVRVEQLATALGTTVRQLQRRCAAEVGVPPKWVLRRYRIYDAAEAVAHGEDVRWADLAADLGFSDQAHLVREFVQAFAMTPTQYALLCRTPALAGDPAHDPADAAEE